MAATMGMNHRVGIGDVLDLALNDWEPRAGRATGAIFGAAGASASVDDQLLDLTSPVRNLYRQKDPFMRMFETKIGQLTQKFVKNESRTLAALDRLSLEVVAQALRMTGQVGDEDRMLVIPGVQSGSSDGPDRPPVLMVLSPAVESPDDSRVVSDELDLPMLALSRGLADILDPDDYGTPEGRAMRNLLRGGQEALAQLFLVSQPEVILTRRPRMIPLCVPSPHLRVERGAEVSTAGVVCRDPDGEIGVTACHHGTGPIGTPVRVAGYQSRVKHASAVQDTVFIPLLEQLVPKRMLGLGGVREDREPAKSDRVRFDGAINQNRETRIFGTDNGLLRARPTIMLKLQTDADTDRGDSGCALIDHEDRVLGFAFERTDYDDHPQFTDWIWAANALRALRLTAIGAR